MNRNEVKTTRPSLPPTSCTWSDSTLASCVLTGASSRLSSTNSLSSCMVRTTYISYYLISSCITFFKVLNQFIPTTVPVVVYPVIIDTNAVFVGLKGLL